MNEKLRLLASKLGIATQYSDAGLNARNYDVDDETVRFFANALGYKADTDEEVDRALQSLENKRWQRTLESVYVREQGRLYFDAVVASGILEGDFGLRLRDRQTGGEADVSFVVNVTADVRGSYTRLNVEISSPLEIGYYDLEFKAQLGGRRLYRSGRVC